jgi:hypothetical protein
MGFVQRAFTPGGGEAPEAIAQREAAQVQINQQASDAAVQKAIAAMPAPPKAPGAITPGSAPGVKQRIAQGTATTMLGAAAAGGPAAPGGGIMGEKARKTVLG